jgi:branched-chain amino acid transport system permease protein
METQKSSLITKLPYIILASFFILAPFLFKSRTWLNAFITIFVSVVGAVSMRTISLSGNMSFAHGAFIGIGAYTAGVLGKELGVSILLTVPAGAATAMLLGLITGLPFARLRSIYFCMGSMFMGVAIIQFISSVKITGGAVGLRNVPSLSKAVAPVFDSGFGAFLERVGIGNVQLCYYILLFITLLSLTCLYRFEHSRIGWILKALSQSPEVASSTGINEKYFRLLSVCFGCFFAGLIGAVYAHYNTTLSPNSYSMGVTLWLIMYMMIGGMNNFLGPILGAIILELIKQISTLLTAMSGAAGATAGFIAFSRWVGQYAAYVPFFTALVLLIVVYCLPGGIVSLPSVIRAGKMRRMDAGRLASSMTERGNGDAS